jgi:hypothetical protein
MFTARYELHLLYNIQVNFLLERVNVLKLSYSVWREGGWGEQWLSSG